MCKFSSDISFFSDHNEDDQFQYSFQEAFIQLKKKMNVSIYIVYYNQNRIDLTEFQNSLEKSLFWHKRAENGG